MKTKKKWLSIGLSATVLTSVALVGCGSNTATTSTTSASSNQLDANQTLNLPLTDEVPTLDVSKASDELSFTVLGQIDEGLVRLDQAGTVQKGIATSWDVSSDGLTYTFHLRNDVKWSNGDPVTAKDFEYSWKRTLDPKTQSQYAFMLSWIKGGADYNAGKSKDPNSVQVKATDDQTLTVTLDHPVPFFISQMAFPAFFPQDQKFVEAQGTKYGADAANVIGDGPFKLTSWNHNQSLQIVKNDTYYNKSAIKLQTVNFQVFTDTSAALNSYLAGQLDRTESLNAAQVDTYKSDPNYGVVPELTNGYIEYEVNNKALSSAKVRQALTYAVDADAFADIVYHNGTVGADGIVPNGTADGNGGEFRKDNGDVVNRKANAAKAKELLAEGLKEEGLTSFPSNLKLTIDNGDLGNKAAQFIQGQWKQNLGINVSIDSVPFKLRLQKEQNHQFDILWALWGADYNDPMTFLDYYTTGHPENDTQFTDPTYDNLIHQAQVNTDPKSRLQEMEDAEKELMKQMPIGPLFFRAKAYLTQSYVKDFVNRENGPDYDLSFAYISGKK